jgi:hypothetical protein
MMNGKRLAQVAHGELIERLANAQETLIKIRNLRHVFGDEALPPDRIFRSHNNALSDAKESMRRYETLIQERVAEYTETIREIEKALASADKSEAESFGQWVRERMKEARAEAAANPSQRWRDYSFDGNVIAFMSEQDAKDYISDNGLLHAKAARNGKDLWKIQVLR